MNVDQTLEAICAAECGGTPSEYEVDESTIRSLDAAATSDIDLSRDTLPVEFDDLDLETAEAIDEPVR
jgi:hypothetical protein